MADNNQFEPYIRHIRFPYYKNLQSGLQLTFDFPITAIVGPNGCNKSSILKALYGSPQGKSLAEYWFSTKIDPIEEGADEDGRPRFIYGYRHPQLAQVVECVKMRVRNDENPDYWESMRPRPRDGMANMPEPWPAVLGERKTRWELIRKNVEYIDFRSEISAFDKYFHHQGGGSDRQDYIRWQAGRLRRVIDEDLQALSLRNVNRVFGNRTLDAGALDEISRILGRDYIGARIISHSLFKVPGQTIILESSGHTYSEAFAGSGEFAVVSIVDRVLRAERASLILLDEPEVSLHPGAQLRLLDFLFQQVRDSRHQIIFGTHSPTLIRDLPPSAIKTLQVNPANGRVVALNECVPEMAFVSLGQPIDDLGLICVEDRLTKAIVERAIRLIDRQLLETVELRVLPGGASTIKKNDVVGYVREQREDVLVILDGDQRPNAPVPRQADIPVALDNQLAATIQGFTGCDIKFPIDGGAGGGNANQLVMYQRRYIDWFRENVRFLRSTIPEDMLWRAAALLPEANGIANGNSKDAFVTLTKRQLGRDDAETVSADEVFATQQRVLANIGADDPDMAEVTASIRDYFGM